MKQCIKFDYTQQTSTSKPSDILYSKWETNKSKDVPVSTLNKASNGEEETMANILFMLLPISVD